MQRTNKCTSQYCNGKSYVVALFLHQDVLVSRFLWSEMDWVMKSVINVVNPIKGKAFQALTK